MKKTLKKLTAFLTSVLMCGVSLLDFPAGSFNISLPSWAADEGGGIYVCDHAGEYHSYLFHIFHLV